MEREDWTLVVAILGVALTSALFAWQVWIRRRQTEEQRAELLARLVNFMLVLRDAEIAFDSQGPTVGVLAGPHSTHLGAETVETEARNLAAWLAKWSTQLPVLKSAGARSAIPRLQSELTVFADRARSHRERPLGNSGHLSKAHYDEIRNRVQAIRDDPFMVEAESR